MNKDELRQKFLRIRRSLPTIELKLLSGEVAKNLFSMNEFQKANVIGSYVALKDEVQTESIIRSALKMNKRVIVPLTNTVNHTMIFSEIRDYDLELGSGRFGILEPKREYMRQVPLEEADLILAPLIAWDERGYRVGYGKGYFDRALSSLKNDTLTVGLALESQRVPKIPNDSYDVPLDVIVTENRVIHCSARKVGKKRVKA
jgi:5-formyltetrahydrofolate cyclo-ligase